MPKKQTYSKADMAEVMDSPEVTVADFKRARPFAEMFPELADKVRRSRGPQKTPTKKLVSLRIDPEVVERFRASGPGWQSRANAALRKAVGLK